MGVSFEVTSYRSERVREMKRKLLIGKHASGYIVQQRAKAHAPVDTGLLRASITYDVQDDHVDIGVHAGEHPGHPGVNPWGYDPTAYFCFQELGSSRNKAHPYLRPGLQDSRDDIERAFTGDSPFGRLGSIAGL